MLGLTVPDAIALGTLIIALAAMYRGKKDGDAAKKDNPPEPAMSLLGASIVSTGALQDLIEAIREMTAAMRATSEDRRKSRDGQILEVLERLAGQIDKTDERDRRNRPHR